MTPGFTVFGNEVLFRGIDIGGADGLWMTNGTAAGTKEITGTRSGVDGSKPDRHHRVRRHGTVQRRERGPATSACGRRTARAGGTQELIPRLARGGGERTNPTDMTVFNDEVLFNGVDANGLSGLWVTDGTAGGTQELVAEAAGASSGLDPTDMTVFGGEVLFNGVDASGLSGLLGDRWDSQRHPGAPRGGRGGDTAKTRTD